MNRSSELGQRLTRDLTELTDTVESRDAAPVLVEQIVDRADKRQRTNKLALAAGAAVPVAAVLLVGWLSTRPTADEAVIASNGTAPPAEADPHGTDDTTERSATDTGNGDDGNPGVPPTVTYPDDGEDRHPHVAPQPPPPEASRDLGDEPSYLGMSEEQARITAEEDGLLFRVVWRDGEHLPLRSDRRADRVSVHIEDGHVVEAFRG